MIDGVGSSECSGRFLCYLFLLFSSFVTRARTSNSQVHIISFVYCVCAHRCDLGFPPSALIAFFSCLFRSFCSAQMLGRFLALVLLLSVIPILGFTVYAPVSPSTVEGTSLQITDTVVDGPPATTVIVQVILTYGTISSFGTTAGLLTLFDLTRQ